jgi:hypothetical protein
MKSNKIKRTKSIIVVDPDMPRFRDDPFFKKKAESFKALLEKCNLLFPPSEIKDANLKAD